LSGTCTLGIMIWIRMHRLGASIVAAAVLIILVVAAFMVAGAVSHANAQDALDQCNSRLRVSGLDEYEAAARCAGIDPADLFKTE
jgi:hypothetical protein